MTARGEDARADHRPESDHHGVEHAQVPLQLPCFGRCRGRTHRSLLGHGSWPHGHYVLRYRQPRWRARVRRGGSVRLIFGKRFLCVHGSNEAGRLPGSRLGRRHSVPRRRETAFGGRGARADALPGVLHAVSGRASVVVRLSTETAVRHSAWPRPPGAGAGPGTSRHADRVSHWNVPAVGGRGFPAVPAGRQWCEEAEEAESRRSAPADPQTPHGSPPHVPSLDHAHSERTVSPPSHTVNAGCSRSRRRWPPSRRMACPSLDTESICPGQASPPIPLKARDGPSDRVVQVTDKCSCPNVLCCRIPSHP
jgi:hypothetical protein